MKGWLTVIGLELLFIMVNIFVVPLGYFGLFWLFTSPIAIPIWLYWRNGKQHHPSVILLFSLLICLLTVVCSIFPAQYLNASGIYYILHSQTDVAGVYRALIVSSCTFSAVFVLVTSLAFHALTKIKSKNKAD